MVATSMSDILKVYTELYMIQICLCLHHQSARAIFLGLEFGKSAVKSWVAASQNPCCYAFLEAVDQPRTVVTSMSDIYQVFAVI